MRTIQQSYAAGVLAPSLRNRNDLAKWQIGLAEANNMFVHVHGGASNRPGTYYVGNALGPNRKIPFEFSVDDTYVLEFSEGKIQFIRNGGYLVHQATMESAAALTLDSAYDGFSVKRFSDESSNYLSLGIYNYQTPPAGKEIDLCNFGLVIKDDDQMYLRTEGSGGTDRLCGSYNFPTSGTPALTPGENYNFTIRITNLAGPATLNERFIIFTDNDILKTMLDVTVVPSNEILEFYNAGDMPKVRCNGDAPWNCSWFKSTDSDLSQTNWVEYWPTHWGYMKDILSLDKLYNRDLLGNLYPLAVITETVADPDVGDRIELDSPFAFADLQEVRYVQREDFVYLVHPDYGEYALTRYDHYTWEIVQQVYTPLIPPPENLAGIFGPGTPSPTPAYPIDYQVAALSSTGEESLPCTAITVTAHSSSEWQAGKYVSLTWDAIPGADLYVVYKSSRGYFGYIGSTTDTSFIDDNIAPDSADGPKTNRDPFSGNGNQPRAVGIYQQRKFYGGTDNAPQTIWSTVSGTMENLSVSRPTKDTDAITAPLDTNKSKDILHLVPMKEMVVLTNNGIYTLNSGANSDALTPNSARYDLQDATGCSFVPPIISGNTILVVPNYRRGVKELFFQIQSQGFQGSDLEIMSNHLFENDTIKEWAYLRDLSQVWCCMESGNLNILTYLREHEVVAWTTADTLGTVESLCAVQSATRDVLYLTVKRNLDGVDVYSSEFLTERLPGLSLADSIFMDCALTYDGAPAVNFTAAHLANETCVVLADGNVHMDVELDDSGQFTLPEAYSKVHVGLPYVADFETLDVDYSLNDGSGFAAVKNINEVMLAIENTRGIKIGPTSDESDLTEIADRTDEAYDEATRMVTTKRKVPILPHWNSNGRIHVRQSYPLPMTILSHIPEVTPGDD